MFVPGVHWNLPVSLGRIGGKSRRQRVTCREGEVPRYWQKCAQKIVTQDTHWRQRKKKNSKGQRKQRPLLSKWKKKITGEANEMSPAKLNHTPPHTIYN